MHKKKQHRIACRSSVTALSHKKFQSITQKKKTTLHPQKQNWNDPAAQEPQHSICKYTKEQEHLDENLLA